MMTPYILGSRTTCALSARLPSPKKAIYAFMSIPYIGGSRTTCALSARLPSPTNPIYAVICEINTASVDERCVALHELQRRVQQATQETTMTAMTTMMTATTDEQLQLLRDIKQELIEIKQALVKPPA